MNNNNHTFLLLGVTILFIFVALANTQSSLFSLIPAYSSTQQDEEISENNDNTRGQIEETETSQENADFEISDDGVNNNRETPDSEDPSQVQQPSQIDMTSPNVLSVTPNVGTSGIPVTTTITVTFSEPVDASTVTPDTFILETDNNKVQGSISLSTDGTTAVFTPSSALAGSVIYTATISDVKDLAGNTMNFASPWSFTTGSEVSSPSQTPPSPPQQPSPSTPSNPNGGGSSGGGGNSGGSSGGPGGGVLGDIKTSPTEKDVLKDAAQYVEDEKMVDRILPIILSKMDKRQLAATVLPYLDLQVSVRIGEGETKNAEGDTPLNIVTRGSCAGDEILIGGGFQASGTSKIYYNTIDNGQWHTYASHNPVDLPSSTSSTVASYPICLKAELVPKDPNAPTLANGGF